LVNAKLQINSSRFKYWFLIIILLSYFKEINMKKIRNIFFAVACLLSTQACKQELQEVTNINQPSVDVLSSEAAVLQFAKGGVYINGIQSYYSAIDDGLSNSASGSGLLLYIYGFHEAMGDVIYVPWGNADFKYLNNPTTFKLDDGTTVNNPIGQGQPFETKLRNSRAYGATNSFLYEWTAMYFMNNALNVLLSKVDATTFAGDAATKKNVLKAWAYWWKGYAYSRIGSMYIAGVINDEPNKTNGNFVTNTAIIDEATKNFDKSAAILKTLKSGGAYDDVLKVIIPGYCQAGKGGIPSPDAWLRNINTYKARNIIANKRVKDMTSADWTNVAALTDAGIQESDPVFIAKTYSDNTKSILDKDFGWVGAYTATDQPTYFVSERLVQDFRDGDARFENNFDLLGSPEVNKRSRGLGFGTRYYMIDGGLGNGAITYAHTQEYGTDDIYLAGSYEENELIKAEANIRSGKISAGTALIDKVRTLQGAKLAKIPSSSTAAAAIEELRSERRIGLLFRGLAFYDARRTGVIDDISKGGGRTNAVVLSGSGGKPVINKKATINYNYLSYWDVPQNDLDFNTPSASSAPVKNPN
jgi:starch-binding outer membrane protein, SusD/RagB family